MCRSLARAWTARARGHLLRCGLVIAALAAAVHVAAAQGTINYASIAGRITDTSGEVVPGATVSARRTETNVSTTTTTDSTGRFLFPYLTVGTYEVSVRLDGFATATRTLTLTVGAAFDVPVTLQPAGVIASVSVTGAAPSIDAARTQSATTVAEAEIQTLPLNGRNFLDVALLAPGVSPTNVGGGTQTFPETSAVPGVGLSVGSQRNFSNSFIVDGLSDNDDAAGLSGITYSVDAVDQLQVVTSGGQAELGRALGGYVNVVTKSGTNVLHGNGYFYGTGSGLSSANPLVGRVLPGHAAQYGASVGGPIVHDRTFFFANVEQRRLSQTGLVTILDGPQTDNLDAINARLTASGYPGPQVTTGLYGDPIHTTNALGKIDHEISGTDRVSVRYSAYGVNAPNSRGAGGLSAPSAAADLNNFDETVALSNVMTVSARGVNETRAQMAYSRLDAPPTDPVGPAVAIAGVATFGTLSSSPTSRVSTLYEVVDSFSYQAGAHAFRAGVDLVDNDTRIDFPRANRGSYSFSSLATFLAGTYNNAGYTQTFGATGVSVNNPNLGLYAQDEWSLGPGMTVNAGVRYDLQWLDTVRTDTNNVSPRLGFAWSPSSGKFVIRGSTGVFYDRVPLRALANALLSAGNTTDLDALRQTSVTLSPAQTGAPVFPAMLPAAVPSTTMASFTTIDPNLQNAYSIQGTVEVQHELGAGQTVGLAYQHLTGRNLIAQINQNVPTCVAAGTNNGCRPNPTYANNNQYSAAGRSTYDGLSISLAQQPVSWGSYRFSYTLSKAMDDVGEAFFNGPIDPMDIMKDWGRSDDDQRHRLVFDGTLNTPSAAATTVWQRLTNGFQLSAIVQFYSALPLNITSGVMTVQGTTGRPIVNGEFIERNAGTGPDFFNVNLRVSRFFGAKTHSRIQLLAEAFNLTNRENIQTLNGVFGAGAYPVNPSSSFAQPLAVAAPRSFQFGVRLEY